VAVVTSSTAKITARSLTYPPPRKHRRLHVKFANYAINPFPAGWPHKRQLPSSSQPNEVCSCVWPWLRVLCAFLTLNSRRQANLFHKFARRLFGQGPGKSSAETMEAKEKGEGISVKFKLTLQLSIMSLQG